MFCIVSKTLSDVRFQIRRLSDAVNIYMTFFVDDVLVWCMFTGTEDFGDEVISMSRHANTSHLIINNIEPEEDSQVCTQ